MGVLNEKRCNKLSSFVKNLELLTGPDSETLTQELTTESNKILNLFSKKYTKTSSSRTKRR